MDRRLTDRRLTNSRDIYVLDVEALAKILYRRKALLLGLLLLILTPVLLFVFARPSHYVAQASVLLEDSSLNLADFRDALPNQPLGDINIETQIKVISSPTLVQETLDALASGDDAPPIALAAVEQENRYETIKTFLKNLTVGGGGKSRIIDIAYKSDNPYDAAKIVNTHTEQYVTAQIRGKKEKIGQINEWITQQVETLRDDSRKKAQAIQEFQKDSGIVPGKNSQEMIRQQIADLTAQLGPVETTKLNLQAKAEAAGAGIQVSESPLIKDLKTQLSLARQELQSLSATHGPSHPSVIAANKRVHQASADLSRETGSIRNSVKTDLEAATKQEAMIRARLEELNKQLDELREKSITLESLEAEEAANRTLLDNFLTRAEELKSQLSYDNGDVRIVSLAEVPTKAVGAPKIILLILGAIFSIVFAVGAVLLLELIDRGIEDEEDIKKILNLRLVGTLPKVRSPLAEIGKRGDYVEELKRIYLALSQVGAPQSVLFTASRSGEGKTTISMTLARYLASIGTKVIAIDANTTSPSLAELSGVNVAPGFADILSGASTLDKAIHKDETGLSVIPCGNQGPGIDLLSSKETLAGMIETLKKKYDFIIVDCAPILKTTDAEILAGVVDQTVLVIEWARAPKKYLNKVATTLRHYSKGVPSVILNKHP